MAGEGTSRQRLLLAGGEQLSERIQLPSSGGAGEPPQTFGQARALLRGRVRESVELLGSLPEPLRGERVIFEATVLPNFLANSQYPRDLFDEIGVLPVGTRAARGTYITPTIHEEDAPAKTYLLSGYDDALTRLSDVFERPSGEVAGPVREDVAKLQDVAASVTERILRLPGERFIEIEGLVAMEAVINPVLGAGGERDAEQLAEVLEKWREYAERLGGDADLRWARSNAALTFLPTLLPRESLEAAALFNPLRALRAMPRIVVAPDGPLRAIGGARLPAPSSAPSTNQRIALFDGTVADTVPALEPYVAREDLTGGASDHSSSTQHATTVASAAAFGNIDTSEALPNPPAAIDAYRVWPPPKDQRADRHMYWVLDQIVAELARRDHAIVSLSIGPEFTIEDDSEPHRWTATLDELAATRGTLFLVAAGNTGEDDPDSGANRLNVPGDLINGLSVGACDQSPPARGARAPYSSVGPGRPGARVAPQVLACGGHLPSSPFICLVPGGQTGQSHGTSLAAPTLARSLAELAHALGNRTSLNSLRAFAVHFASRDPGLEPSEAGYGRVPDSFLPELSCEPNEVTLLYEQTLRRAETMMLPLPIPEQLLRSLGRRYLKLRWTLAFASTVDPTDPVDYSQAGITAIFRPHADRYNMNLEGADPIALNLRTDVELYRYLIREGRVPGERPITRPLKEYAPETERRQDGKWETMIRIDDRMQASTLSRPVFDMHLLTRQAGQLSPASAPDELDYTLLLSVIAPSGVQLYDAVRAEAPVLAPVTIQPPLRVQI
jgi:hypothetical protein